MFFLHGKSREISLALVLFSTRVQTSPCENPALPEPFYLTRIPHPEGLPRLFGGGLLCRNKDLWGLGSSSSGLFFSRARKVFRNTKKERSKYSPFPNEIIKKGSVSRGGGGKSFPSFESATLFAQTNLSPPPRRTAAGQGRERLDSRLVPI